MVVIPTDYHDLAGACPCAHPAHGMNNIAPAEAASQNRRAKLDVTGMRELKASRFFNDDVPKHS